VGERAEREFDDLDQRHHERLQDSDESDRYECEETNQDCYLYRVRVVRELLGGQYHVDEHLDEVDSV
jgi:hypothetical protein